MFDVDVYLARDPAANVIGSQLYTNGSINVDKGTPVRAFAVCVEGSVGVEVFRPSGTANVVEGTIDNDDGYLDVAESNLSGKVSQMFEVGYNGKIALAHVVERLTVDEDVCYMCLV